MRSSSGWTRARWCRPGRGRRNEIGPGWRCHEVRRFLVLLFVLAACGGSGATTSTTPAADNAPPTTAGAPATTSPAAGAPAGPEPIEALELVVTDPSALAVTFAADAIAQTGEMVYVPYLIDLIRVAGDEESFARVRAALAQVTGETAPEGATSPYAFYGSWLYRNPVDAGSTYLDWKSRLYGLIDPDFEALLRQVDDPVLASQIQWGGVLRGGIPELNNPATLAPADAGYMQDDELTFGAVIDGDARSYPHRILDHHELANDTLGGEPVALANCTLCRTGVLFSRRVGDRVLQFETSGLLINSNKIMVDLETETLWEQLTGIGLAGELAGTELDRFFLTVTTWGDWLAEHPDTDVVAVPDDGDFRANYSYEPGDAYASYYESDELWFPVLEAADVFPPKTEVATLDLGDAQLAVDVDALRAAGPQLVPVGDSLVAVVPTSGGARFYDATASGVADAAGEAGEEALVLAGGTRLPRLQSGQSFWFAWYGAFPATEWWPAG